MLTDSFKNLTLIFLGSIVTIIANAALLYSAHLTVRRYFNYESITLRWIACSIITVWYVIVISNVLIFSHLFTIRSVLISSLGLAIIAWFCCGKYSALNQELSEAKAHLVVMLHQFNANQISTGLCPVLLVIMFLAGLSQGIRALMIPPLSWDSLTYHLPLASLWIQNGGYARLMFPDAWDCYSHLPSNGEVFFSWLMLPFTSDLLVNLGNFPFLLIGALSVYALAKELGIGRELSLLASCLVILSPPLFAFATTQYVDVQVFAEEICSILFLIRYSKTAHIRDAIMVFIPLGIAVGTKITAILLLISILFITLWISLSKHTGRRTVFKVIAAIIIIAATVTAPWYFRNWFETGSPLYPFSVKFYGVTIFQGSAYMEEVFSMLKSQLVGHTSAMNNRLWISFITNPTEKISFIFGPKIILILIMGIIGIGLGLRHANRVQWTIISLVCLLEIVQYFSPGMYYIRLFWPWVSQRFLMLPFSLLAISGIYTIQKSSKWRNLLIIIMFILICYDLKNINLTTVGIRATILYWFIMCIIVSALYSLCWLLRDTRTIITSLIIASIMIISLPFIQLYRDETRYNRFCDSIDLHPLSTSANGSVSGWQFVDDLNHPKKIAVLAGWDRIGHNWFLYPIMGRRLQNNLTYEPLAKRLGDFREN